MASRFFAVISGAGSGTGRSAALRFAQSYAVLLLARSEASYQPIVDEIRASGGTALGVAADAADASSVAAALARAKAEWPDRRLAAAIYNANAGFSAKPFLELTEADLDVGLATAAKGFFVFAQKTIPELLDAVPSSPYPPSLIVTGATASLRGGARFGSFAAGKFAQRALAQSLAREFGPKGVHVALAIIDGGIDTPWSKTVVNDGIKHGKLKPDAVGHLSYSRRIFFFFG
jgi:NAD(P)-dependent dehydrogenase (short-subunit alcohol dehydrogenase family)